MPKNPAPFGAGQSYMDIQADQHDAPNEGFKPEQGNASGPAADGQIPVGTADFGNDGSYAAGLAEAKNHNS